MVVVVELFDLVGDGCRVVVLADEGAHGLDCDAHPGLGAVCCVVEVLGDVGGGFGGVGHDGVLWSVGGLHPLPTYRL